MLSLLGITFVASLGGEDQLKGIVAGGIGLMLATIGMDPISGIQRYTFGQLFLWDGIGLVPITIGFYAIPETIELAVLGTSISQQKRRETRRGHGRGAKIPFPSLVAGDPLQRPRNIHGDHSGMGRAATGPSGWPMRTRYRAQPDKERFGKGDVEGVLGPGAANNSTLGGSLITTIALGCGSRSRRPPSSWDGVTDRQIERIGGSLGDPYEGRDRPGEKRGNATDPQWTARGPVRRKPAQSRTVTAGNRETRSPKAGPVPDRDLSRTARNPCARRPAPIRIVSSANRARPFADGRPSPGP